MATEDISVPPYWFGPRMLRRWLWRNKQQLSEETRDGLAALLSDEVVANANLDVHAVIQQVLLNVNYSEIIVQLDRSDFERFIYDTIDFWTSEQNNWGYSPLVSLADKPPTIKQRLIDYFNASNLRPRLCISLIEKEMRISSARAQQNVELASQYHGLRQLDASVELRQGCSATVEKVEQILDLLLEFAHQLLIICGANHQAKIPQRWGGKEVILHYAWYLLNKSRDV